MHELSVALEVCRMTEERLGADGLRTVRAVGVEVGEDAGIEIGNFEFCLEALLAEPPFAGARPVILRQPGDMLRLAYLEVDDGRPDD
jgi:Zn finger protein HypA/HybF involved in hydrogenase expression